MGWSVLNHTPRFEPANSEIEPPSPAGSGEACHLPSSSGAESVIPRPRYGPLTSIGATPETKPWVWSKSPLVGTEPSA